MVRDFRAQHGLEHFGFPENLAVQVLKGVASVSLTAGIVEKFNSFLIEEMPRPKQRITMATRVVESSQLGQYLTAALRFGKDSVNENLAIPAEGLPGRWSFDANLSEAASEVLQDFLRLDGTLRVETSQNLQARGIGAAKQFLLRPSNEVTGLRGAQSMTCEQDVQVNRRHGL